MTHLNVIVLFMSCLTTLSSRAKAQAASRLSVTAEAPVESHDSPRVICGGRSGTGRDLSQPAAIFSVAVVIRCYTVIVFSSTSKATVFLIGSIVK